MCKQADLQKLFPQRKEAKILPLSVSLEITTQSSKTTFINTEVLVNEMDIPHTYDLIGIVKDDITFFHIDELVYIQLTQDITKAGFYVIKTEFGIEMVIKRYGNEVCISLKRKRGNKNEPLYQKCHVKDFLFIFGKIIYQESQLWQILNNSLMENGAIAFDTKKVKNLEKFQKADLELKEVHKLQQTSQKES